MADIPTPFPQPDRDTAKFWEAQNEHRLVFQKCSQCGSIRYLVGPLCPECHSFEHEWAESSGRGTIYSFTTVRHQTHPAFVPPYTVLLVEMEEGPRLVAQLRAPEGTEVVIGAAVHVEWEDHEKQSLPVFELDE
ncbi:MAG: Zn-ribbon domain-containing OB-fold protein [Chloroflexi bacterium]|nr:Zn-ribbon domain-containing OB-fold protein [Chloroflexota bacterium]